MKIPTRRLHSNELEFGRVIGKGGDARVYRGLYMGEECAIKVSVSGSFLAEVDITCRIDSGYILRAIAVVWAVPPGEMNEKLSIVYPLARGSIADPNLIQKVPIGKRIDFCYQLARALSDMHSSNVLHLDIKPSNVLVFGNGAYRNVKLADFGYCLFPQKNGRKKINRRIYTEAYRSPELMKDNREYSRANDIWSLGLTFAYILSGKSLVMPRHVDDILKTFGSRRIMSTIDTCVVQHLPSEEGITIRAVRNLLGNMLSYDSVSRPNISQVIAHDLFVDNRIPLAVHRYHTPIPWEDVEGGRLISLSEPSVVATDYLIKLGIENSIPTEIMFLALTLYARIGMIIEYGIDLRDHGKRIMIVNVEQHDGMIWEEVCEVKIIHSCMVIALKTHLIRDKIEDNDIDLGKTILGMLEYKINVKTPYDTNYNQQSIIVAFNHLLIGDYYISRMDSGKDEYIMAQYAAKEDITRTELQYKMFNDFIKLR